MRAVLVALLIACLGISNVAMAEDTHVAIFKNVSGKVDILRGQAVIHAFAGMPLLKSDVIVSGQNASSGIAFKDSTLITLGSSTEMEISHYVFEPQEAKYDFSLYMKRGTAIYSSGKIGKLAPESVNLNTPRAMVGVRGTRFIIEVD